MSEVNIDDLSLRVSANANDADDALDRLAASLGHVMSALDPAGQALASFASTINRVRNYADDLARELKEKNFNIDLKVNGAHQVDDLKQAIETVAKTIDGSSIAKSIAEQFNIEKAGARKQLTGQIDAILQDALSHYDGKTAKFSEATKSAVAEVNRIVRENGKVIRMDLGGGLDDVVKEYRDFLAYVDKFKIKLSDSVSKELASRFGNYQQQFVGLVSERGKIDDSMFSEMESRFPSILSGLDQVMAKEDGIVRILEEVRRAREDVAKVSISELGKFETAMFSENLEATLTSGVKTALNGLGQQIDSEMARNAGSLNIDLKINQDKIVADIQSALKRAATVVTEPIPVNLQVNTKSLQKSIAANIGSVDLGNFPQLVSALKDLENINGLHIQETAKALAEFGTAKVKNAAANMKLLGEAIVQFVTQVAGLNNVNFNVAGLAEFIESIGQLGRKQVERAAATLPSLADGLNTLISALAQAPAVSANTVALVQAMSTLPRVIQQVNRNASKTPGILSMIGSGANSAVSGIRRLVSNLVNLRKGSNKVNTTLRSLVRQILPFLGIRQLFNWGKNATETAASLTEVQNVVDVTFQDMASKVQKMSETSIEDFGMSELTVKQIAGRFQSMSVAMGLTASQVQNVSKSLEGQGLIYGETSKDIADMSLNITKLAGDLASFQNVEASEAAEALQSIWTGQTKPMRRFGVDLSQATLQTWALKKGMDADISSMTQAQKTMLRYQYVLERLGYVQGDFIATSTSWANQTRMLVQQLGDVGKNVGNMVIGALKPFVMSLNTILTQVRTFTKNVLEALGHIFGWQVEVSNASGDLSDLDEGSEDLGSNLEDAEKAAKKLKNTIMSFDELNVLNGDTGSDNGSGSGNDALNDALDGLEVTLKRTDPIWKQYESDIDSLSELGQYFADALNSFVSGFDVDEFREKMSQFGAGLAQFFNGFNDPEMFSSVGDTIAGGLNGIVDAVNAFLKNLDTDRLNASVGSLFTSILTIDWESVQTAADNIGSTFGEIANGLFSLDNMTSLGAGLGQQLQAVIQSIFSFTQTFDFAGLGKNIAAGLNTMLGQIDTEKLFAGLVDGISGLGTSIGEAIANIDWKKVLSVAFSAIGGIVVGIFKGLFNIAGPTMQKIVPHVTKFVGGIAKWFKELPTKIKEKLTNIGTTIGTFISNKVTAAKTKILEARDRIAGWFSNLGKKITDKIGSMKSDITTWATNIRDKFKEKLIGADGNGGVRGKIIEWFRNMPGKIFSAIGTLGSNISKWATGVRDKFKEKLIGADGNGGIRGKIVEWFSKLPEKIFGAIGTLGSNVSTWATNVRDKFKEKLIGKDGQGGIRGKITEWFSKLPEKIFNAIGTLGSNISSWATSVRDKFREKIIGTDGNGGIRGKVTEWFSKVPEKIFEAIGNFGTKIKDWADEVGTNFKTFLIGGDEGGGIIGDIVGWFSDLPGKIFGGIGTLWSHIVSWTSDVKSNFEEKMLGSGGQTGIVQQIASFFWGLPGLIFSGISGIASHVREWVDNVKTQFGDKILGRNGNSSLLDDIVGFFGGIWNKMKSVGDDIMGGIWEGINNAKDWLKQKIDGVVDSVVGWWKSALGIASPSKVFAEIGGFTMLGFEEGMENQYGGILQSLRGFESVLTSSFANAEWAVPSLNTDNYASMSGLNISETATVGLDSESLQDAVISGVEIALANQGDRPINVNAVLKTENDEVLARAVTRGQRSIAYRTNPTALAY